MDSIRPSPRKLLALLALTGILVGACSGAATSAPASPSAASAAASPSAASSAAASAASASASGSGAAIQLSPPEVTTLQIGVSAPTEIVQFSETLADKLGYYKDLGFTNVTVTGLEGDGKVVSSLVAGALNMGVIGASAVLTTVGTSAALKVVAMNSVKNTDSFVCTKDIKTAADVKGKVVAVSTFGGTSHGSVIQSLTALGLSASDVTITQVGNEGTRIAALKAGSIGCAPVGDELNDQMKGFGFNILTDLASSNVEWGRSGLVLPVDFITKNPNATLDIVAAVIKAQNYIFTNPADVVQPFADFSGAKPADAQTDINAFVNVYGSRSMGWSDQALTIPQQVLATVNPAVKNVDVTQAEDRSFLQKLWDGGYFAQIGDPSQPFK